MFNQPALEARLEARARELPTITLRRGMEVVGIDQDDDDIVPEDDAWYDHQLVGLDVVRDDQVVGRVIRVEHFPAQDLLIVRLPGDREVLVPFVKAIVPEVDVPAGRILVTPPAGLFEDLPADDGDDADADADAAASADEGDPEEA